MMQCGVWAGLAATRYRACWCSTATSKLPASNRKPEWWQVAVGVGGVAVAIQQYKVQREQSHDIIEQAAKKILDPFDPPERLTKLIPRNHPNDLAMRLIRSNDGRTTIIAGQFQVGKTTLVEATLEGERGVVKITVDKPGWELTLFKSVGVNDKGMFVEAMKKAKEQLRKPPLLYINVPRYSTASMAEVSVFCKEMVTDEKVARGVVVASQLGVALGFDAGGKERQYDIWVPPMTETEAHELMTENFPQLQKNNVEIIIEESGTNPGVIQGIAYDIVEKGMTVDAALEVRRRACKGEVNRLLAIKLPDSDGKVNPVGQQITKALQKADVDNERWDKQGILVKVIAARIEQMDAFAVSYHTVEEKWHFASPMHKKIVQQC